MDELTLRRWESDDTPFLWEMLYLSLHVRPGNDPYPRSILEEPAIAHYLTGFGDRNGDDAIVCTSSADGTRVGAAWVRQMTAEDPGYGYVENGIPELGMAVLRGWRGRGIGRRLLLELLDQHPVMSLSVDDDNAPAKGLYESLGFVAVETSDSSTTMLRQHTQRLLRPRRTTRLTQL